MPAWSPDASYPAGRRPSRHSLRVHPKQRGDLTRCQQAISSVHSPLLASTKPLAEHTAPGWCEPRAVMRDVWQLQHQGPGLSAKREKCTDWEVSKWYWRNSYLDRQSVNSYSLLCATDAEGISLRPTS
ncbi:hypothetical protein GCM10027614_45340 [Micromonospora vulcania]